MEFVKDLVAYADPWSVTAGDELAVMVSCHRGSEFSAELVRLICGDDRPRGTGFREQSLQASFAGSYPAREQFLRMGSYAVLCDLPQLAAVSFAVRLYPTTPERHGQVVASCGDFLLDIFHGSLRLRVKDNALTSGFLLRDSRWHEVVATFDAVSGAATLAVRSLAGGVAEVDTRWDEARQVLTGGAVPAGDWLLAGLVDEQGVRADFNGRMEAPRIFSEVINRNVAAAVLAAQRPAHPTLLAAWDFAEAMATECVVDVVGGHDGYTVQTPTRAVKGSRWNGSVQRWTDAPEQYAAIHFHQDDLTDAGWEPDLRWQVPQDLPSGVYAVKLTAGTSEDYVPFFVRPASHHKRADVVYLASTATYLAYANQRLGFTGGIFGNPAPRNANDAYLLNHDEVGYSLYEYHADRSGVHFSSRLRPVLNAKPRSGAWSFNADSNVTNWLHDLTERAGLRYDVITDEDLHREGAALLAHYRVVVTGTHPEYYSTSMLGAMEAWLGGGGRLMYLGGNGFYWRIAYHPTNPGIIEVRRAEDGTRAWIAEPGEYYHAFTGEYGGLWRRLGRPPNRLAGVGFAAQGFDGGTYYRLKPGAFDPRAAFIMAGVQRTDVIGDYGTQGGGAAGEEIDRWDADLGSPRHALVLASSEKHRAGMLRVKEEFHMTDPVLQDAKVRADMVFFETPAGGAVFSTGSISYAGALAVNHGDNDIARITGNVLRRFLDPEPFSYPGPA